MAGAGAGAGAGNFPSETYTHPSTTHLKYISTTRICTWTIHMAYVMKEEAEEQPSPFDRKFRKSLNYTRKIFPNILEKGAGMGSAVIHSVQQINEPYTKTNKFNWITLLGITIECSQDFPPFSTSFHPLVLSSSVALSPNRWEKQNLMKMFNLLQTNNGTHWNLNNSQQTEQEKILPEPTLRLKIFSQTENTNRFALVACWLLHLADCNWSHVFFALSQKLTDWLDY